MCSFRRDVVPGRKGKCGEMRLGRVCSVSNLEKKGDEYISVVEGESVK